MGWLSKLRAEKLRKSAQKELDAGNAVAAFGHWADLARRFGDAHAQYEVGKAYLEGAAVPYSRDDAIFWFSKAKNYAPAMCALGDIYAQLSESEDESYFDDAKYWLERAAEAGSGRAPAILGRLLSSRPARNLASAPAQTNSEEALAEEVQETEENAQESSQESAPRESDVDRARGWLEEAAERGDSEALLGLGRLYLTEGDVDKAVQYLKRAEDNPNASALLAWVFENGEAGFEAALEYWERAAQGGLSAAQYRLGTIYLNDKFDRRDPKRAVYWLKLAGENGEAGACALLGEIYAHGLAGDAAILAALSYYEKGARLGDGAAAEAAGLLYLSGSDLIDRNPDMAGVWLARAAFLGKESAYADLGNLLLNGTNVPEDTQDRWRQSLRAQAEKGDAQSAYNLAIAYLKGIGGERNLNEAHKWFTLASSKVVNAHYQLGRLVLEGAVRSSTSPAEHFKIAADAGMIEAGIAYAQLSVTGQGGADRNHERALSYYEKAARAGSPEAMFSAGALWGGGHDVPTDRVRARQWFERSANGGNALGAFMFGRYLVRGLGGQEDLSAGIYWLKQARSLGVERAAEELGRLNA